MARVRAPTKQARTTAAKLLAAIHADVRDLAARGVYADVLQELGDPRGELIALQLQRGATGKPTDRELELLTKLRAAWLGPLAPMLATKSRFVNGFLTVVVMQPYRQVLTAATLEHPEWQTVEVVDTHGLGTIARLAAEPAVLVPRLPHLRELSIDALGSIPALERGIDRADLTSLAVSLPGTDPLLSLLRSKKLPKLRALRVWNEDPGPDVLVRLASATPLDSFGCFLDTTAPARAAIAIGKLMRAVATLTITCTWGKARITSTPEGMHVTRVEISRSIGRERGAALRGLLDQLGRERVTVAADPPMPDVMKQLVAAGFRRA